MKSFAQFLIVTLCLFITLHSTVEGQHPILEKLNKKLEDYNKDAPSERVFILTDRDVYAQGDVMWLHATVYELFSPKVSSASNELDLTIVNGENTEIMKKTFSIEDGTVQGCMPLPEGLSEGVYYIRGSTDLSSGADFLYKKILLKSKIVPPFVIEAEFENQDYIPGDNIPVKVSFKDYYNEPKRNISYRIDFFDGKTKIPGFEGKVKKEGMVQFNAKVPLRLKSGLFRYRLTASTKGKEAKLEGKFPVLSQHVFLDFYPENGFLIDGIMTKVNVYAYDAVGEPLAVEADLLENGTAIKTFTTGDDGLGSVVLLPDVEKSYTVQLKRPLLLDQLYALPEVQAKGIALRVLEKTDASVKYQLISGYKDERDVYLIGSSKSKIFHVSEHQIQKEFTVEVPLDEVEESHVEFVLLNAAYRIEGAHILAHNFTAVDSLDVRETESSTEDRGKVQFQIDTETLGSGDLIFGAVNDPWLSAALGNQSVNVLSAPFDSEKQMVFQSGYFHKTALTADSWKKYTPYYVPGIFGWDHILDTKGAFQLPAPNDVVNRNLAVNDQLLGKAREECVDKNVRHSNQTAGAYFATSNPIYITKLYQQKAKKKPAYKTLLENGTPVLDVVQSIKPYKLEGNLIIFYGTDNSINFQGGALIAIDGINRGTDASVIANLSPYDVETIFCSTNPNDILRYTGLNTVGIVEITLKNGRNPDEEKKEEVTEMSEEFEAPDYDARGTKPDLDYRSTLYWNVMPIDENSAQQEVTYFNSDLVSDVKGNIIFIPKSGVPRKSKFGYTIR